MKIYSEIMQWKFNESWYSFLGYPAQTSCLIFLSIKNMVVATENITLLSKCFFAFFQQLQDDNEDKSYSQDKYDILSWLAVYTFLGGHFHFHKLLKFKWF